MSNMCENVDRAIEVAKAMVASRTSPDDIQKVAQSILNLSQSRAIAAECDTDEMDEELTIVLAKVRHSLPATALVQITQAVLNLMTSKATLTGKTKTKRQGASAS